MEKNNKIRGPQKAAENEKLSGKNIKLRWIIVIALILIAAVSFTIGISGLISRKPGWMEIEANASEGITCAKEFILQYDLGADGSDPTIEYKQLTARYTEAATAAYKIFSADERFEGTGNLCAVNSSPNVEVEVDKALYDALSLMESSGKRQLYLAPIYYQYNNLFGCQYDYEAENYDPFINADMRAYFADICRFASDPSAVSLRLLGNNRVMLYVSGEYLSFATEYGISTFIDFFWMKNAFIADYIAQSLADNGFENGTVTSFDGFTRNLDRRGTSFSQNIFSRQGERVYQAAVMEYAGPMAMVSLRAYPMGSMDEVHYYQNSGGEIRSAYASAADGLCRAAREELLVYSHGKGCAGLLLDVLGLYIADELDEGALKALSSGGVYAVYTDGMAIRYTQPEINLNNFMKADGIRFTAEPVR